MKSFIIVISFHYAHQKVSLLLTTIWMRRQYLYGQQTFMVKS